MKKISVLLLVLAMVLTFAACNKDKPCETHVDDDENGICDVCEATLENQTTECTEHIDTDGNKLCDNCGATLTPACETHTDDNGDWICDVCNATITPPVGLQLSDAVIAQLEAAESVKIEFNLTEINSEDSWEYVYNETTEDYTTPENYLYYYEETTNVVITASKNSNGGYNVKIDAVSSDRGSTEDELEVYQEGTALYIIDGVAYTYNFDMGVYTQSSIESDELSAFEDIIGKLAEAIEITETERETLLTLIGDSVNTAFNIKDNKGSVSVDLKGKLDELIAYIAGLDMENDTVGGVIDDILALVSEDLTSADVIAELERVAGLTVNEALAELDAWLTENYETTVQDLYDTIVNDDYAVIILTECIKANASEVEESELDAYVADALADIQDFKLADAIANAEVGDAVLYELISGMMAGFAEDTETIAKDDFFDMLEANLAMTLGDLEGNFGYIFKAIKEYFSGITVNKFDGKLDLNFKGVFNIDTIEGAMNSDIKGVYPSEVDEKSDTNESKVAITFKVYDILTTAVEIKLPDDAIVIKDIIYEDFYSDDDTYGKLYIYGDVDGFSLEMELNAEGLGNVRVIGTGIAAEALISATTITIDGENVSFYYDNILLPSDKQTDLVVVLDPETYTYTVTQCPEYGLSVNIILNLIGYGEGVDNSEEYDIDADLKIYFDNLNSYEGKLYCDADTYWINSIIFSYYIDSEGNMVCTVIGFINDYDHTIVYLDKVNSGVGGFYADIYENFSDWFGGDVEFTLYVDENGVITCDDFPVFSDEYMELN